MYLPAPTHEQDASTQLANYPDCFSAEGGKTTVQRMPWFDYKQSDGEVPVMLEFWGMRSTPSLPSLPGPL